MQSAIDKLAHGWGPEVSPLMIISDYPTKEDVDKGKILNGASGALISQFLRQNKYSLNSCYKSALFKCQLPGFGTKNKKQNAQALRNAAEIADWEEILIKEIKYIQPNVILSLGELSLNFLTGETNINRFRGSILPLKPQLRELINSDNLSKYIRVIPTYHPRDVFFQPINNTIVSLDIGRALRFLSSTREFSEPGTIWIARTAEALIEYWKRARHGEFLTTDIETRYNFATCASLCTDGNEAVSFPLMDFKVSIAERACMWLKYNDILKSNIPKVNQNIVYDWTILNALGFTLNNIVGDTMLMAHTLYPELPKGLDFLTSIYTDMPYYKDEGKDYDPKLHDFDRMLYYNAKDALTTWQVWKAQQKDAEDLKVKKFYFNFVHPLLIHYKKVNDHGIRIDEHEKHLLLDKYYDLLEKNQQEVNDFYGKELNVRSPQQVGTFLYEYLNCPVHTHVTPNGNIAYSTDEDTLVNMYLNEVSDDLVKRILRQIILCRKIENVLVLLENPYHPDKRMRSSYNLGGTTTGRTSTSQAVGWYLGINDKGQIENIKFGTAFQKIRKHGFKFEGETFGADIRKMFVPSHGYEFFQFDGANAEGRCVCVLAEDYETLDYIEAGNNIHKLTASWIFEKPIEFIDKKDEKYDIGKRARHAGNLGQTGGGLSTQIYKSVKFSNEVMAKFHKMSPNIINIFHLTIQNLVTNQRYLVSPSGRRRDFFSFNERKREDSFKQAYSFMPQSAISDHFKKLALILEEKAPYAIHIGEFHDSLLYEIPIGTRETFAKLVNEEAPRNPIKFNECSMQRDREIIIPLELEFSNTNWYEMQEFQG